MKKWIMSDESCDVKEMVEIEGMGMREIQKRWAGKK